MSAPTKLPDDLRVVNCAGCDAMLAVDRAQADALRCKHLPTIAGRMHGRPYCAGCLDVGGAGVSGLAGGMATDHGSPSPWHENATRAHEEAR